VDFSFHLDFDPHEADHRQAADWLSAQPDPTTAVAQLIKAADMGVLRLQQWEDLVMLLATEVRELRAQLMGQPLPTKSPETQEDPESARRLDSIFG
jgi:ATP/maltotriose-dependent transcriptional regulator MalT